MTIICGALKTHPFRGPRLLLHDHYLWCLLGIEDSPSSRVLFRGCIDNDMCTQIPNVLIVYYECLCQCMKAE